MKYRKVSGFADEIAEDIDTQFRVLGKLNIQYFNPEDSMGRVLRHFPTKRCLP